jgi:hypothetical protein
VFDPRRHWQVAALIVTANDDTATCVRPRGEVQGGQDAHLVQDAHSRCSLDEHLDYLSQTISCQLLTTEQQPEILKMLKMLIIPSPHSLRTKRMKKYRSIYGHKWGLRPLAGSLKAFASEHLEHLGQLDVGRRRKVFAGGCLEFLPNMLIR